MFSLSILGFALGVVAQLIALFASSKFAFASGVASTSMVEATTTRPREITRPDAATVGEPTWANLMRGM
jgi:hypothetical protein